MAYNPIIDFYDEPGGPNGGYKGGGSGGGGTTLGELIGITVSVEYSSFSVSTAPYDISGETYSDVVSSIVSTTNVCGTDSTDTVTAPSGCYVAIRCVVPSDWSTDSLRVSIGGEPVTSGFECKVLAFNSTPYAFFTMQIPETVDGVYIEFGIV